MYLSVQVSDNLGRIIVAWTVIDFTKNDCRLVTYLVKCLDYCATTDVSNDVSLSAKMFQTSILKDRSLAIKRAKTKDFTVCILKAK